MQGHNQETTGVQVAQCVWAKTPSPANQNRVTPQGNRNHSIFSLPVQLKARSCAAHEAARTFSLLHSLVMLIFLFFSYWYVSISYQFEKICHIKKFDPIFKKFDKILKKIWRNYENILTKLWKNLTKLKNWMNKKL